MQLFYSLKEDDKHNAIHYCMHNVVDDLLNNTLEVEVACDDDCQSRAALEDAIIEAKKLSEEQQFEFLVSHDIVGQIIFDIAIDMARNSYYMSNNEMVIYHEDLRCDDDDFDDDMDDDDGDEDDDTAEEKLPQPNVSNKNNVLN